MVGTPTPMIMYRSLGRPSLLMRAGCQGHEPKSGVDESYTVPELSGVRGTIRCVPNVKGIERWECTISVYLPKDQALQDGQIRLPGSSLR